MKNIIAVIGGGAAGFFGAIAAAESKSNPYVVLFEKNRQVLSKVRISGGGRCNVTHSCFEPSILVKNYPRGSQALRGPFTRFQPKDTVEWFEQRGVHLKTEEDGRMFPTTDSSETIIQCLQNAAKRAAVEIKTECGINNIKKVNDQFHLELSTGETFICDKVLIATGSHPKTYSWMQALGHTLVPQVPSLFTFNVPDSPFLELSGVSVPKAHVKICETNLEQTGPLLITHWGFSGPAVLKLSAWGARILHDMDYKAKVHINWIPDYTYEQIRTQLLEDKKNSPSKQIGTESRFELPKTLWKKLLDLAEVPPQQRWADLSNKQIEKLCQTLRACEVRTNGKTTYKEEFVTCGGIDLKEINFQTMESRLCPGLYFAGEVIDIDGITGGFNFQNAWTTSWIAAQAMTAKSLESP